MGWFSTPPSVDGQYGVEEGTFLAQATNARGLGLTKSAEPSLASSSALAASPPNPRSHLQERNDAGPSTSVGTPVVLSSSNKSPLTTRQSRGAATYAYRTAPSLEQSSSIHLTPALESPSAANSAIPPIPMPSTSSHISAPNLVPPSRGSSEPVNRGSTAEGQPPAKQKSARRRKREGSKRFAASAATVLTATTDTSPDPIKNMPAVPMIVEDRDICDPSGHHDGQTEKDLDVPSILADIRPGQITIVQSGGEQTRSGEIKTEPDQDDPALSMRAGLIVNGVSFHHKTIYLSTTSSQWPYTALSELRNSALMSIIGVVSSAREPTQSQKGGMGIPPEHLRHSRRGFLRLVHFPLFTGSFCPGLVWWRSLRKRCRHKNQLLHENGAVGTKPKARRHCSAASCKGATRCHSLR